MKTIFTIILSVVTTILTLFGLLIWFEYEILPVSPSIVPAMTYHDLDATTEIALYWNEEQQRILAIEGVAEAIVGIQATTDGFGGFLGNFGGQQMGTGSGIVYQVKDGNTYIVTNEHVIDRAIDIEVVFTDEEQTRKKATLVGSDVYTDLAVLRIENFEASVIAEFGNTEDLRLGQTVIAIGNPLGLEFAGSTTMGVVSGHNRQVSIPILSTNGQMQNWAMTVLQTDTAINPGNSGGALINLDGEVIGINSMKVNSTNVEGMSFSIPTYIALPIISDLETYGRVVRPVLGVSLVNIPMLPQPIREEIKLPINVTEGVFVNDVVDYSIAMNLGVLAGDVITHIGDVEIRDSNHFRQTLFTYRDGYELTLTLIREGSILNLSTYITISQ